MFLMRIICFFVFFIRDKNVLVIFINFYKLIFVFFLKLVKGIYLMGLMIKILVLFISFYKFEKD